MGTRAEVVPLADNAWARRNGAFVYIFPVLLDGCEHAGQLGAFYQENRTPLNRRIIFAFMS